MTELLPSPPSPKKTSIVKGRSVYQVEKPGFLVSDYTAQLYFLLTEQETSRIVSTSFKKEGILLPEVCVRAWSWHWWWVPRGSIICVICMLMLIQWRRRAVLRESSLRQVVVPPSDTWKHRLFRWCVLCMWECVSGYIEPSDLLFI